MAGREDGINLFVLLALGAGAFFLFMRRANAEPAYDMPQLPAEPLQNPLTAIKETLRGPVSPAPPTAAGGNVVPITTARVGMPTQQFKAVTVANPLKENPNAPGAAKAYRYREVNYWLVALPPAGDRYYMSDAEIARYGARKV